MPRDSAETRKNILEAAWAHLECPETTTLKMGTVARKAGVSRQAVYLHFGSRAQLLLALVEYVDLKLRLRQQIEEALAVPGAQAKLESALMLNARYASQIQGVAHFLERHRFDDEEMLAAWDDRMESRRRTMQRLVEAVSDQLEDDWSVDRATDAIWALGFPSVYHALIVERGWTIEQYGQFQVGSFRAMLRSSSTPET